MDDKTKIRIEALTRYNLFDAFDDDFLDHVVGLASCISDSPIALISLLDSERQFFKAKKGVDASETPIDWAFCRLAINKKDQFLSIVDAEIDERVKDNPLVTGDPHIRCYHGAVLVTPEGVPIGTVCAIDTHSKDLGIDQKEALKSLSKIVMDYFCLKRDNHIAVERVEAFRKELKKHSK